MNVVVFVIFILIGLSLLMGVGCAVWARRLPGSVRAIAVVLMIPALLFCAYGFVCSFEGSPGAGYFKVGYALAVTLFTTSSIRLVFAKSRAVKPNLETS